MTQPPRPPIAARKPRIALAHDWLVAFRGGEVVLEAVAGLAREIGEPAGLYAMFALAPEHWTPRVRSGQGPALHTFGKPRTSWLNNIPGGAGRLRRWMLPLYPAAVADLSRRVARDHAEAPIDLLISTSSAAIKGLRPPPGVPHLCYCHSPARYLWSQAEEYARGRAGKLRGFGLNMFGRRLRDWDRRTADAAHVTQFLANSNHIAREVRRCYGREAEVVFPPIDTEFFTPPDSDLPIARGDHWLCAGALEPYKRVDLVISAANQNSQPLVIVGTGSQSEHLRSIAGPTVTFLGRVDDDELLRQYRAARMLVFPQIEDFGIIAVEAQACGTPVLAFKGGGALDTVIDRRTGAYFERATADDLIAAAARVPEPSAITIAACRENAQRFSHARFDAAFRSHVEELLGTRSA